MGTIPDFLHNAGISIAAFEPLLAGKTALVDDSIASKAVSYDQEVVANGGYWAAGISFVSPIEELNDWLVAGLARHIVVKNQAQVAIWEGVVNQVSVNFGGISITVGPLLDTINRLAVVYQTVTYNTNPPVGGQRAVTAESNNTDSQAKYGILQGTLSGGTGTATEMEQVRDTYLAEYGWPRTSQTVNLSGTSEPSVKLECAGYARLLEKYVYTQTTNAGTDDADDKIQLILAAEPNSLFSDYSRLDANTLQVREYENEDTTAWELIKDVVARGDASDNRWIFGVYANRQPRYNQVPTSIAYDYTQSDAGLNIHAYSSQQVIYPWDVGAGKWLRLSNVLPNASVSSDFNRDPRIMFIESARYTAPMGLSLNGGKTFKVSQQLARLGLGGS